MFAKFHAGDFSLDDAPWLGRPVEVDSNQIETLIENNQCYTGDSQHIQNIQINKVIGESEMCLLFCGKNHSDFSANPILIMKMNEIKLHATIFET